MVLQTRASAIRHTRRSRPGAGRACDHFGTDLADLAYLFGPDRIHPNASGHQLMADAFAALLLADGQVP